jgi:uncharacterized protein YqjF (DUF2071 family)
MDPIIVDVDPRAVCPSPVARPVMVHGWNQLTFLHWRYDPAEVQALLPPGLTVETFDGSAWVALVPFVMQARLPWGPAVPWVSNFPETNVRTYVTGPDGSTGVWFLSLDASRLGAVLTARGGYRLPYFWSKMAVDVHQDRFAYTTRRRWPGPRSARSSVQVEVGERFAATDLGDLDHWLTARWTLYSAFPHSVWKARADHGPWALFRAEVCHLDDTLVTSTGLSAPVGDPLVHHSPGVEVRISLPTRVSV